MIFLNRKISTFCLLWFIFLSLSFSDPFKNLDIDFLSKEKKEKKEKNVPKESNIKNKKNSYNKIINGFEEINGLFTLFWNSNLNKAYISILPDQLDSIFLAGITRQSGDALFLDGSSMLNEYPFMFKKIGKRIQYINVNTKFRAEKNSPFSKSVESHKSHSILSSTKIISDPHPKTGAILIDLNELFLFDIERVTMKSQGLYSFDKKDSYIKEIKSFPYNTEIELNLHFKGKKPVYIYTLPNSSSMISTYHISLSSIIKTNYKPRIADDRVGHFTTMYQDYSDILRDSPYIHYINRWHIEKKYPNLRLSEPKKPITYWIENTVPYELRDAVREGILAWNKAFEKAGIKNAIVVKQMPDDATWDPADVRYNTIRWILQPGSGYAVGPSRANPFTGELYDADIRISADFVRGFYSTYTDFVAPLIGTTDINFETIDEENSFSQNTCHYGEELVEEMGFAWDLMIANGTIKGSKAELNEYIHKGLMDLVLHEVGHTLGLRHNFKGSSIYSIDELSDPHFTRKNGISGSVMDYQPINVFNNETFFQTQPGVYDIWAIEYAYKEFYQLKNNENILLNKIASRSIEPKLRYGTDEDTFGLSTRGIDPQSNAWDFTSDPIKYYEKLFLMSHELWESIPTHFEKNGHQYSKLRKIFGRALRPYYSASRNIAKYIGGIYHSRHHIGDDDNKMPFKIVEPNKQREALQFILSKILAEDVFNFDPNLLNKLAPKRDADFKGSVWRMGRIDYPIHDYIRWIQTGSLYRLHHPRIFARIRDNELKVPEKLDMFTLTELFTTITNAIWSELNKKSNINSFRRDLQKSHIEVLTTIILNKKKYFHSDAIALARVNLREIYNQIRNTLDNTPFNKYTYAHLNDSANKIQSIYSAQTIID